MKYLDTRDLNKRLDELESMFETQTQEEASNTLIDTTLTEEELEELKELRELRDEISEWSDGETLIPESEFENYARDFAVDIDAISDDAKWPCYCIDWGRAANQLRMDYSSCEYQGTTYYYRS